MTDPREHLRNGELQQALAGLKADVRKAPRDARLRTFLFQLFCVTGEWDRALTQLKAAAELDPEAQPMLQAYQVAIRCEVLREKVFRGQRTGTVLGDPGEWLPLLIEANRQLAAGKHAEAARLRDAAFDAAPESDGTLNGTSCAWVADADPRLGPVLEAVVDGKYVWVPYTRLRALELEPPGDLRDQIWMPARFTWTNGGTAVGFIPTRYPGSAGVDAPLLALARRTEWRDVSEEWSIPVGQRVLVSDGDDVALMDLRELRLGADDVAANEAGSGAEEAGQDVPTMPPAGAQADAVAG